MGRHNIYNPKTNLWRCYSTIVNDWVSEWMNEKDYKSWLYEEYIKAYNDELKPSRLFTFEELEYQEIRNQRCNDRCNCNFGDLFAQCDDCYYNRNYKFYTERYKNSGEDPLNVFNNNE